MLGYLSFFITILPRRVCAVLCVHSSITSIQPVIHYLIVNMTVRKYISICKKDEEEAQWIRKKILFLFVLLLSSKKGCILSTC